MYYLCKLLKIRNYDLLNIDSEGFLSLNVSIKPNIHS